MSTKTGNKIPPARGSDGRLYFNFGVGSQYIFYPDNGEKPFDYLILASEYVGNTEYYNIQSNGKTIPRPISANRLKFLLSTIRCELIEPGEQLELPLLREEVDEFYLAWNAERTITREAARKKLRKTEYGNLYSEIRRLVMQTGIAEAKGDEQETARLNAELERKKTAAQKILDSNGITAEMLSNDYLCEKCKDSGMRTEAVICDCAHARTEEIKKYCAAKRSLRQPSIK